MNHRPQTVAARCPPARCVAWFILLFAGGCSHAIGAHPNPLPIDAHQYPHVYQAAIDVLRDHNFTVAKADYRYGRIVSDPLGSPTIFEPWYDTNTTTSQAVRGTLNDEKRQATILLQPNTPPSSVAAELRDTTDPINTYLLSVRITVERHRLTTRHLTGSTNGRRVFGTLAAVPAELRELGFKDEYWEPVGRDEQLEQRVLDAIVSRSSGPR